MSHWRFLSIFEAVASAYDTYLLLSSMNNFSSLASRIFDEAVSLYLHEGGVDAQPRNPYPERTIEHDLFRKNWIDHAQWGLEDIIRDPEIAAEEALRIKRRIDRSNQERTDLVELIDSFFLQQFADIKPLPEATINTESPAWAIDRLSILKLKIYYMGQAAEQASDPVLKDKCLGKLATLKEQDRDLCRAIDELLADISAGRKYMKVYKQMKMYNDPQLNPMLKGQSI